MGGYLIAIAGSLNMTWLRRESEQFKLKNFFCKSGPSIMSAAISSDFIDFKRGALLSITVVTHVERDARP